jgi:hypothetical protein
MKKVFITLIILLAILAAFYGGYYFANHKPVSRPIPQPVVTTSTGQLTPDLSGITEKDFVTFAQNTIEPRCPFYKPDGATYRGCLGDWEQDLESKNLTEQNDEVHAYCSKFVAKYADEQSLEGQELFLKCAIFKLQ